MSSITQIALDLAQLAQNIARLQEQAAAIPDRARVAQVEGANQEDAQRTYFRSLEVLAARIGQRTEVVRRYVDANAEADGSSDSRREGTRPKGGAYCVSGLDAHDQGGPAHVYRLVVRPK